MVSNFSKYLSRYTLKNIDNNYTSGYLIKQSSCLPLLTSSKTKNKHSLPRMFDRTTRLNQEMFVQQRCSYKPPCLTEEIKTKQI